MDYNNNDNPNEETMNINKSNNPFKHWWFAIWRFLDFKSRSSRKEFWLFYLGNLIIFTVLIVLLTLVMYWLNTSYQTLTQIYFLFGIIWRIVMLLPGIALTTRRFHDTNRSVWYTVLFYACNFFLGLLSSINEHAFESGNLALIIAIIICLIVDIWLFVILGFLKGTQDTNKYGKNTILL